MAFQITDRQRRWLDALLLMGTAVVALVLVGFLSSIFFYFGDVILIFFLAWLLAFILSPIVAILVRNIPKLPRVIAVVLVYGTLLAVIVVLAVVIANTLASSISDFINRIPSLRDNLPSILKPWQDRLNGIGLGQVNLAEQANGFLSNLNTYASQLVGPLQQLAVASLGILGNLLIVVILSLYMVIDRDRILSFLFRLVPPVYADEAALLETSVAQSFGGFLRGQAIMGVVYGSIAAVISAFFFHYFGRAGEREAVATRAAQRLAERQGRAVRVPRPPGPPLEVGPAASPLEVAPRSRAMPSEASPLEAE